VRRGRAPEQVKEGRREGLAAALHGSTEDAAGRSSAAVRGVRGGGKRSPKGGRKYGLLENSEDLCARPQRTIARFTAQNGMVNQTKPLIANQCGKGKKSKGSKKGH
jgi:hypothetical protein